jgi:hypothetical protein
MLVGDRAIEAINAALQAPNIRVGSRAIEAINDALNAAAIAQDTAKAVEQAVDPRRRSERPVHARPWTPDVIITEEGNRAINDAIEATDRALETTQAVRQLADAIIESAREVESAVMDLFENGFLAGDVIAIRNLIAEVEDALTTARTAREAADASWDPLDERIADNEEAVAAAAVNGLIRTIQVARAAANATDNQLAVEAKRAAAELRARIAEVARAAEEARRLEEEGIYHGWNWYDWRNWNWYNPDDDDYGQGSGILA